ncbi:retrotransposon protein, putative, ty1-copia subclass [Tanacetum coccineum]
MGYYFLYYPPENKIVVERYADFLEKDFILQKESGRNVEIDDEDILPSENTSEHPIEEENIDLDRTCTGLAILKWKRLSSETCSASSKCISLLKVVDLQEKTNIDGRYTFISQFVAKGFTQTYGVDYEETFSPVADIRAIRILIAIAAYYDYEIWQMDVKTTYRIGYSKRGSIPMQVDLHLNKSQCATTSAEMKPELQVKCYCDADSSPGRDDTKSQTVYVFVLNGGRSWKFIDELGVVPSIDYPIKMNCDNSAAIIIAKESGIQKGARHFQRKYHYVRECIKMAEIDIVKVHTVEKSSESVYDNALAVLKLTRLLEAMGLWDDAPKNVT